MLRKLKAWFGAGYGKRGCGIGFKIVEAHLEERMGVRLCDMPEQLDAARRQRQEELKLKLLKLNE